ncbi:MAG: alpha/beta fold hydrolase [Rubrivivax sp.]
MPFVRSQGRDIYFERHGDSGPALLFLHGAGSNAATWWQQLPTFARQFSCLTMDIRCFGRSAAPTDEFQLPLFVDDVLALLDHQGIARVVPVGQSLGGMVGLQLALRHPQRVAGFVACDSSLAIDHPVLVDSIERRFRSVAAVSIEQRSLGRWFLERQPELAALYAQINHFNPSAHSLPAEAWRAAMTRLNTPEHLTPTESLRRLACPTLLIVGAEDPIVPVSAMHDVAALVPGSEVVVVDNAAHSAYFEQPAVFNRVLLDFLQRRVVPAAAALA